jgi:thiol:disulfide interchange protein
MMLHRSAIAVLLAVVALAGAAMFAFPIQARADEGPVAIRAVPQYPSVPQGGTLVVAVEMSHKEHYHSWPAKEVKLPDDIDEFAIRTEIGPAQDKDGHAVLPSWVASVLGTQFPKASPGKVPDPMGGKKPIEVPLYSGKAVTYLRFAVKPDATVGDQIFTVRVYSQSCNEETCDMPREELLQVKVKVVAAGTTDLGSPGEKSLFDGFDPGKAAATPPAPTLVVKPTPAPAPAPTAGTSLPLTNVVPAVAPGGSFFGWNIGSSAAVLLFFGAVGGFLLNLTPCVLPVIPIKILSLTQHATSKSHAIVLGAWMASGVIAFWVLAGIPMALISSTLDPSRYIFGVWWITISIGLVVALFGLGIMGLFNITLPQSVYAIESKADSPVGSFMFGVLTAVLGLPCFGFVVGGLLAGAATLPWYAIMAVFLGMGLGMALPYFVLSAYPNLLKFIPRTGPASDLLKQVMGFLLIAGAAFFVTAGIKALISDVPYVTGSIAWWVVGFFIAIAACWMVFRTFKIARAFSARVVTALLGIAMVLGIAMFANGKLTDDRKDYNDRIAALGHSPTGMGSVPSGVWLDYTPELFGAVRASKRSVFLDFTADWCINCKAFKKLFLTQGPAAARLQSSDIVLMEVDCTSTHAPGWNLLKELGRTGVPTWVVYGPDAARDQPMIIDLTTPSAKTVLDAIDAAGVPQPGAPKPVSGPATAANPPSR